MRLTEIRLSGFKSFVDPTRIALPGQIVGVVGPNGCGKSNVIDATRWVLGESSARHLRGETMQDVIFNGSTERKPAGRASVELVFDNALGRAGGAWSQYAEISVKRVLERDGESAYYINGQHVRRRDIADMFLGTGVGTRGYAIIEQGTISRIIEAKPEELRMFLEEAAGTSKYRERRRETENRLADARHNLARVDDIRGELERQVERLHEQAEVARRHQELNERLGAAHNILWMVKRQEIRTQRARLQRDLERAAVDLENQTARLRAAERRIAELRSAQYQASDAAAARQGELYEANAEVARLERELQHTRELRARLAAQLEQIGARVGQAEAMRAAHERAAADWRAQLEQASGEVEETRSAAGREAARLPAVETAQSEARQRVAEAERALAQTEQLWQVEETRRGHCERVLQQLAQRGERLARERAALQLPDQGALEGMRERSAALEAQATRAQAQAGVAETELASIERELHAAREVQARAAGQLASLEARRGALELLQRRLADAEHTLDWTRAHGLEHARRVWQSIAIEPGWEDALEAVLRERLNGVVLGEFDRVRELFAAPPPAKFAVLDAAAAPPGEGACAPVQPRAPAGTRPLAALVRASDPGVGHALADWLIGVHVCDDPLRALDLRPALPPGMLLVTRQGHLCSRAGVGFYAPDSELHGVLSRQREIEQLGERIVEALGRVHEARYAAHRLAQSSEEGRARLAAARRWTEALRQQQHALQLEVLRLSEQSERALRRREQIDAELAEIARDHDHEAAELAGIDANLLDFGAELQSIGARLAATRAEAAAADAALARQREVAAVAQRAAREAEFRRQLCESKIAEIDALLQSALAQLDEFATSRAALETERERYDEAPLVASLQDALALRHERESMLAAARDALSDLDGQLRALETERAEAEQQQQPLRDRVGTLQLREQEARLTEEQYSERLSVAGADETALEAALEKGARSAATQADIARLQEEIAALGAVNLAALDELGIATGKKAALDAQALDLSEAIETLQDAISRIDRETRERLLATYESANRHLAELFPALFGGGQARLVLTGEEILDSGVQVIAQPPGKRNTSIHLLSGGEKALTALALVFALFQLNPAPFCLLDEVDAPLDDSNTERFCRLLRQMAAHTQFLFISHNKITMEIAEQLIGVTMQEQGVSRVVAVDVDQAMQLSGQRAA
jgi:chromosome segregation protein